MVAWGEFAQEIGLLDKLKAVSLSQKEGSLDKIRGFSRYGSFSQMTQLDV